MEVQKSLLTEGAMNSAVALSILADIPSGPVALETSREFKRLQTSSSVHNKLSMLETYPIGAMAWTEVVKQKEFSISASSSLVLAVTLPHLRTGIELDYLFLQLTKFIWYTLYDSNFEKNKFDSMQ